MPELRKPYLLYLGDSTHPTDAKTACGLRDWCPDDVIGEWSLPQATVSVGLTRLSPPDAAARGVFHRSIDMGLEPARSQGGGTHRKRHRVAGLFAPGVAPGHRRRNRL